ncbi:MAG TPA: GNAT family N-acetyltransferase [Marmoricola sp.]|jgi:RimJ/RimL family protein N-acetyltransferase|nr:GNAT family N-acetyltransferase [Marmoricola sp.]
MLRPARDADVAPMRLWRNQPANRVVSVNQHEISAAEHADWWARVSQDPTKQVLVFEYAGQPLGIVTFFDLDPAERTGSWGFFLDSETAARDGVAVPAWIGLMKDACAWAFDELDLAVLHGEVHEGNEAVRAMNRRFRFTEGEPVTYDGRVFYPISLLREDRRQPKEGRP